MSLIGNDIKLKGTLAWKGERGYSAYEIAIQNGYIGSEKDWLAQLGTAKHFSEDSIIHTSTAGQTSFDIPSNYTSNSFIDVYVNGLRLNSSEYTVDIDTMKINLIDIVLLAGAVVEIVVLTMATNNLPIVETIDEEATNDTAPGTKAVFDFVKAEIDKFEEDTLKDEIYALNTRITNNTNTMNDAMEQLSQNMDAEKFNKSNIVTLTGSIENIASGETKSASMSYPAGFTKANTLIISKMCSSGGAYYDATDVTMTTNGYPTITLMSLTDTAINIGMKNTNNTTAFTGHYKITIMRLD